MPSQSLASLLQRASIDDHEEVLQSSNETLAKSKSDIHAQHVKVVALLKLDRYEDCLRVFEEAGDKLKSRAAVEYAYALYKCSRLEEAIDVVSQVANDRGARHLEAQVVSSLFVSSRRRIHPKLIPVFRRIVPKSFVALRNYTRPWPMTSRPLQSKRTTSGSTPGPPTRSYSGRVIRNWSGIIAPRETTWRHSKLSTMLLA